MTDNKSVLDINGITTKKLSKILLTGIKNALKIIEWKLIRRYHAMIKQNAYIDNNIKNRAPLLIEIGISKLKKINRLVGIEFKTDLLTVIPCSVRKSKFNPIGNDKR